MARTLDTYTAALNGPLVVVSDVHLREPDDSRARLLMDIAKSLGPQVECFVLNGDIFDFCFGDSRYFKEKFALLGQTLGEAAARGIRVLFVEGNHEFHLDQIGWQGVEIIQSFDVTLELKGGTRVMVTHGDQITHDKLYRLFRALVKSQFARFCAQFIPGSWLDAYSLKHAKVSRSHDKYRTLHHAKILGAFNRWLDEGGGEHGIIGHFHFPYAEVRQSGHGMMMSVESWDRPNALVFDGRRFQRALFGDAGGVAVKAAESVLKIGQ